jgi:glycerate dehydrogenase
MGIIGYGALGVKVSTLATAFGMSVLVAERKGHPIRAGRTDLDSVLKKADVLVILCPLTPETRDLIGAPRLAMMKPTAILVNVARGGIVSESALVDALRNGMIYGAGLDVLEKEPPREGGPLVEDRRLNVIVTPHMGWCSVESLEVLGEKLVGNIEVGCNVVWGCSDPNFFLLFRTGQRASRVTSFLDSRDLFLVK